MYLPICNDDLHKYIRRQYNCAFHVVHSLVRRHRPHNHVPSHNANDPECTCRRYIYNYFIFISYTNKRNYYYKETSRIIALDDIDKTDTSTALFYKRFIRLTWIRQSCSFLVWWDRSLHQSNHYNRCHRHIENLFEHIFCCYIESRFRHIQVDPMLQKLNKILISWHCIDFVVNCTLNVIDLFIECIWFKTMVCGKI